MFARLLPREGNFFELFARHTGHMVDCAIELRALLAAPQEAEARVRGVKGHEHDADTITHQTVKLLHKTFITPIDREDIHALITRMDDVLDLMEDVAQLIVLYDLRAIPPEALRLGDICVKCTERVAAAVARLSSMERSEEILAICREIDALESEADVVMRSAIARLFREETDARQLIKVKEMYELLEAVTDRCEDVANIIEGIVLENA
jgi:predicted phosphate transport protein (TIGR00153 family)